MDKAQRPAYAVPMPYMVTFDGCARRSPAAAKTAHAALEEGELAEAQGCRNVMVEKLGDGEKLPLAQFAIRYCSRSKRDPNA